MSTRLVSIIEFLKNLDLQPTNQSIYNGIYLLKGLSLFSLYDKLYPQLPLKIITQTADSKGTIIINLSNFLKHLKLNSENFPSFIQNLTPYCLIQVLLLVTRQERIIFVWTLLMDERFVDIEKIARENIRKQFGNEIFYVNQLVKDQSSPIQQTKQSSLNTVIQVYKPQLPLKITKADKQIYNTTYQPKSNYQENLIPNDSNIGKPPRPRNLRMSETPKTQLESKGSTIINFDSIRKPKNQQEQIRMVIPKPIQIIMSQDLMVDISFRGKKNNERKIQKQSRVAREFEQLNYKLEKEKQELLLLQNYKKEKKDSYKNNQKRNFQHLQCNRKKKLHQWIKNFLKKNLEKESLFCHCSNGVCFIQIINNQSKENLITGVFKSPKTKLQIQQNYRKIFNYLSNQQKFNPRFINCMRLITENEEAFWCFLDDLWYFINNKTSPYDQRFKQSDHMRISKSQFDKQKFRKVVLNDISNKKIENSRKESCKDSYQKENSINYIPSDVRIIQRIKTIENKEHSWFQKKVDISSSINMSPKKYKEIKQKKIYLSTPKKSLQPSLNNSNKKIMNRQYSLKKSRYSNCPSPTNYSFIEQLNPSIQKNIQQYLKTEVRFECGKKKTTNLLQDQFRNGITLINILKKENLLCNQPYHQKPKSIKQVQENLELFYRSLRLQDVKVPNKFINQDEIMRGNHNMIYGLIYCILTRKQNMSILQKTYSNSQLKCLINQHNFYPIYNFLKNLQIEPSCLYESFNQFCASIRCTNILYQIFEKVFRQKMRLAHQIPQNKKQVEANLSRWFQNVSALSRFIDKQKYIAEANKDLIIQLMTVLFQYYLEKKPTLPRPQKTVFENIISNTQLLKSLRKVNSDEKVPQKKKQSFNSRKNNLVEWLSEIGFQQITKSIDLKQNIQTSFSNGQLSLNRVLWVRIIEKLQMISLSGVIYNPKTKGQELANVRKVIKHLEKKSRIKQELLIDQKKFLQSSTEFVLRLLQQLKKVYKHSIERENRLLKSRKQ